MSAPPAAALPNRARLPLSLAEQLRAAAFDEAEARGVGVACAILDEGGQTVLVARMDAAASVAVPLATDKAFTAASIGLPTHLWAQSTQPGGTDWGLNTALAGRLVAIRGGLPLWYEGQLVGGLGVSGAAPEIDQVCAVAALQSLDGLLVAEAPWQTTAP